MDASVNALNWFEIPAADFERAKVFYGTILGSDLTETTMDGASRMAFLPAGQNGVGGAIIQWEGCTPSQQGTVVYLNGGQDLQPALDRVQNAGGSVVIPKTAISPEHGYFALFLDSEGNRVGLHSMG